MKLGRNVLLLGLVSFFADISSEMVMPLLPAFLVQLGAGAGALGLIEGAAEATASLLKYASGRWADRVKRLLPLAVAGYALAGAVRPLLAFSHAAWQVLAVRCIDRVGKGIRTSPRDKLLASSVAPARLAEAFGFHRGMDHFGAAIGPLCAAALLWAFPERLRLVFALAAIPGALAVFALFGVKELKAESPAPEAEGLAGPARVPPALLVVIAVFTLGNSTDVLLLVRARELGVPVAQLPLLWTLLHVVRAALSWPLGKLADRAGRSSSLALGWAIYSVCYVGFALAVKPLHAWLLFAAYGLVAGLTEGSERALVASAVPAERRGRALGLYNLVSGVGLLSASVVAGWLWDHSGPQAALGLGASLAGLAALLLLAWKFTGREMTLEA